MDDFHKDFFQKATPAEAPSSMDALPKNLLRDIKPSSFDTYSFSGGGKNSVHLVCEGKNGREVLATVTFISTKHAPQEREIRKTFLDKLTDRLTFPEQATPPKPASHFDIAGAVMACGSFLYDIRHKDADNNYRQFATFLCKSKDEFKFFEPLHGAVGDMAHKRPRPTGLHPRRDEPEL